MAKRVVETPKEVKEVYNTDSVLAELAHELASVHGELGALLRHKVQPLRDEIASLQAQVRNRKVELVRELGLAFASLEELNQKAGCRSHPEAEVAWIHVGKLARGTSVKGELAELKYYGLRCAQCHLEVKVPPDNAAYDCPNCGIVRGSAQIFRDEPTGPHAAYQDSYIYYHCQLCGMELGFVVIFGIER